MSSSDKYAIVEFTGKAKRALEKAEAAALEARLAEQRQREAVQLERDQLGIRTEAANLRASIVQLRSDALAANVPVSLEHLQDRLDACVGSGLVDKAAIASGRKVLIALEREVAYARRQFVAAKVGRALEGAARDLAVLQAEIATVDRRDAEKFNPGKLAAIERSILVIQSDLASRRLVSAETGIGLLREQLDAHQQLVRDGREAFNRDCLDAQQAIAGIKDRYVSLKAAPQLARYLKAELEHLEPDMEALARLCRREQFAIVQQQIIRLDARLDELATVAQQKFEQAEKQKVVTERLMATVIAARGILVDGYPQNAEGKPAVVRFRIAGRGVLHVEVPFEGPMVIRAEGFKHQQSISPDGKVERTCDDFVEWFELIRQTALQEGLEIGALSWDGSPPAGRAQTVRKRKSVTQVTAKSRYGGVN